MHLQNKAAFSPDLNYFAHVNEKEDLLVYEIASSKLINSNFTWNVNTCSCIRWISMQPKSNKAKLCNDSVQENLLAAGNAKGDIFIYNVKSKNLFLHLTGRHHGAINDMYLYGKSNSFFTCSSDQHIAIWDILTGRQISKWKADENPISSICVIDEENLLSSSTVILWWNISKQTVLKKFSGHMTEIIKLLPVNVDSMKSYFLSAAIDDIKINAWSLTSSESDEFVASFSLPLPVLDMDISKMSPKDKPLILSAVTKDGYMHVFEHVLNGNIKDFIQPKVSFVVNPEFEYFPVLSVKITDDAEECIVAYVAGKSTVAFKHVKIKELLQKNVKGKVVSPNSESPVKLSVANDSGKARKNPPINGLNDSVRTSCKSKLRSTKISSSAVPDLANPVDEEVSSRQLVVNQDVNLDDPKSAVVALLEAIEAKNDNIIETIFKNDDTEYRSTIVQILPTSSLKIILSELNHRLLQKYSITLCRWLKEILQVHLRYLTQCDDAVELLNQTRVHLSSMNISKTLHKMTVVQGLLKLQIQESSSDESDSDDVESMEL